MSSFQHKRARLVDQLRPQCAVLGCHSPITAPSGSATMAMRPTSITSMGGANTLPPLADTLATVASASSTLT